MQRLGPIDHLETYLEAVYFDLLVAPLARVERFPYSFDLEGLAERCTVAVRWRAESDLVDYSGDSCPPDLLTTNFAELPRLSVWLEGLAGLAAVPLSPAYKSQEKTDSALVCSDATPRLADTGQQGEAPATVPMMVCWSGLGKIAEAPRVGPYEQKDDWMSKSRKKGKGDKMNAVGEQSWGTERMTDAPKAADLLDLGLLLAALTCRRDIPRG